MRQSLRWKKQTHTTVRWPGKEDNLPRSFTSSDECERLCATPCAAQTLRPVRARSPLPRGPAHSRAKPSNLPLPSRCSQDRAPRFNRKMLERNNSIRYGYRSSGLDVYLHGDQKRIVGLAAKSGPVQHHPFT